MYKDWEAIDKISDVDIAIKKGIANMDITTGLGKYIMRRLPAYFSDTRNNRPVSFSLIRRIAALLSPDGRGYKMPANYGAFGQFGIPVIDCHFQTEDEDKRAMALFIDDQVNVNGLSIGGIVESGDNHYVLVQIGFEGNNTHFYLVAADRIVVD